jgi:DNA-binding response OmpR family regulator
MADEKDADLLVIDGDERTRPAAESWMHSQGYDGHCLPDGWSAVRFLEAYRPRFAVLDLTTLGDDGLDVLELIRRAPRLRDLSLVVHVAVPDGIDVADGFHSEAFLTRGINWPEMRAQSERFVQ